MKKSTFCELALFSGLCGLFVGCYFRGVFFSRVSSTPKSMRVEADFSWVKSAVSMYTVNCGHPPTTAQGLGALVVEPVVGPKPKRWIRLLDRVPLDPWQTPYRYELLTPRTTEWRWELRSAGPDGVFDNADDLATEFEFGDDRPAPGSGAQPAVRPSF